MYKVNLMVTKGKYIYYYIHTYMGALPHNRFLNTSLSDDKTDKKGYKETDDIKNTIKKLYF